MSDVFVSVENASKKFCRNLRRSLWYGLKDLGSELAGSKRARATLRRDEFWAVDDASFQVKRGESIGLIGRNGAGKSTLLRMLSGLIKPDAGQIEVRGRMQALIALGAGFDPVLTGRENLYINAAVLGLSKREVDNRFEEIVEFSGIDSFIDAPVQSYSSGMAVRLGFSVAVHMAPDILLVDEVLAVGDIPFRAKCFKKLGDLKKRGVPFILVSHDMGTIRNQSDKVIFLDQGKISSVGSPEAVIADYLYSLSENAVQNRAGAVDDGADQPNPCLQAARIVDVKMLDNSLTEKDVFRTGEPLIIRIDYVANHKLDQPSFGIHFYGTDNGMLYTGTNTSISGYGIESIEGHGSICYRMDTLPFLSGIYRVRADIWDRAMGMVDKKEEGAHLHVKGGEFSVGVMYTPGEWFVHR